MSDFQPLGISPFPRFSHIATFMRLPHVPLDDPRLDELDIGLIGVPFDLGVTNRTGPRHGPRQIRDQSSMIRRGHRVHGTYPFQQANCADVGDAEINPANLHDSLAKIEASVGKLVAKGIRPLSAGGDHLISLPLLRAVAKDRPVGMVHFDAHTDTWDSYFGGEKYTHGTPFRRAIEEGLLDPKRVIQIGIRGSVYDLDDDRWGLEQGIRIIYIEDYFRMGPDAVIAEARRVVGDGPTYLSFDVDGIDPAFTPGTGTPEVGGYTPAEAQKMLRGLRGIDFVGADVVEVSPPFDQSGNTALVAANLMFEILALLADRVAAAKG
ncbi:agmatinase [Pseudoxanthobacter sp. M-2]|uniref:agmatinase n=1 Tax=Pseudoxanthobacter sp. M-2 TaxID=3078754 RepID=UPI0038FC765B